MKSLDVGPIYERIWKWLPIKAMSGTQVSFGELGLVTFDFDQLRVMFGTADMRREIAVLEPAAGREKSIDEFKGRIAGERFECEIVEIGNFLLKRLRLTIRAARERGPMRELVVDGLFGTLSFILPGIVSVTHNAHHLTHVAYAEDCEPVAQVVGAVASMNLVAGSCSAG